jgi:hypothetical protein
VLLFEILAASTPLGCQWAFFPSPSCLRCLLAGEGRKSFKFFGPAQKPPQRPLPFDSDRISAPNARRCSVNGCLLSMAARRSLRLASATSWHKIRADVLIPIQDHRLLHGRRLLPPAMRNGRIASICSDLLLLLGSSLVTLNFWKPFQKAALRSTSHSLSHSCRGPHGPVECLQSAHDSQSHYTVFI